MKIRRGPRTAADAVTSGSSSAESEQALASELNFIDSLSDLEELQATYAAVETKQQHAFVGSPDSIMKQELHDAQSTDGEKKQQDGNVVAVPQRRAKFSAEVRKARHRDRMQRVRMAEKKDIEVKRVEMESLESQLQSSIGGYLIQDQEEAEDDDFFFETADKSSSQGASGQQQQHLVRKQLPPATVRRKYVGLVLQQDQIKKENAHLVVRIHEFQKYEKLVAGEMERTDDAMDASLATSSASGAENGATMLLTNDSTLEEAKRAGGGYWLSFTEKEPPLFFEPLSWLACQTFLESSYNTILSLQRGVAHPTLPGECFGWSVSHGTMAEREDGKVTMQHRFVKTINPFAMGTLEPITIDTIADNTWTILNSSELYGQIYRTDMISKVLQQVDDRTSVLLRTYPDERQVMRARFLSLIAKVEDSVTDPITGEEQRRVSLLLSVLDPDECLKTSSGAATSSLSDSQANWLKDGIAYLSFKAVNFGQEIELEHGGFLDVANEALQPAVVRNILEAMMRWERAATRAEAQLLSSS
ncbi:hypothetical protein Gpo141_00009874 [Globisporangium polare]